MSQKPRWTGRGRVRQILAMFDLPTQLIDYRCTLEAVDRNKNIARSYRIQATRDLFGHTIIELRWGRIGTRGSGLTISFADEEAALRFVARTLARRASAPKRIGVNYVSRADYGPRSESMQIVAVND